MRKGRAVPQEIKMGGMTRHKTAFRASSITFFKKKKEHVQSSAGCAPGQQGICLVNSRLGGSTPCPLKNA